MADLADAGTRSAFESGLARRGAAGTAWPRRMLRLWPWLVLLLTWELASRLGFFSRLFFPPPSAILAELGRMLASGSLLVDLGYTLFRLLLGFILGGGLGLASGLWLGWSSSGRGFFGPIIAAVHPLPKLALLPLALIIFGLGEQANVVLIALTAFFPMVINTMTGVLQIDDLIWEVSRHYQASGWILLRRVIWPGSLPLALTGAQIALNTALMVTVAVEMVNAQQGLGEVIWLAWQTLRVEELYAALIVIALIGLSVNWISEYLANAWIPWQVRDP